MLDGVMLDQARIDAMTRAGHWRDRTILDYLDEAVRACPDRVAVIGRNSASGETMALTWRQLSEMAARIAMGLIRAGVVPGEVVAWQLPNWWQFVALHLACMRIGAISNPLMPIFRQREMRYMLAFGEARLLVVPQRFRNFDHAAMIAGIRSDLPLLRQVLVVGGSGADSFEDRLLTPGPETKAEREAVFAARRPQPNQVIELLYTSGTTGRPKGVLHISNTIVTTVTNTVTFLGLDENEVILMSSPMAHQTGFLYGLVMAVMLKGRLVLQDIWHPAEAAALIREQGVTLSYGATPFLTDLSDIVAPDGSDTPSLRLFVSAGAPIPRVLARTAARRLGATICSGWGMSENGLVTGTNQDDPPETVFDTDGAAFGGMEVRVVDDAGRPVAAGSEGQLQSRGPNQFVGYLKAPDLYATDGDGWFDTGDLARMDEGGYIRISGRSKDLIIRGGENIPAVEVEELLYRHPDVLAAAITAMPDRRLGERCCAWLTLREGRELSFPAMVAFLLEQGLSKTYLPERLELIAEMPRTASGKIQKFQLREMIRAKLEAEAAGNA